jgi:hypothetical protein
MAGFRLKNAALAGSLGLLAVAACSETSIERRIAELDAQAVTEARQAALDNRPLCVFTGLDYGRSGLRAQQYTSAGPKGRVVIWSSPDFTDPKVTDAHDMPVPLSLRGKPRLAVQIAWRVTEVNGNTESMLESLRVQAIEVAPEDAAAAADWEIIVLDGERLMAEVAEPQKPQLHARFVSDETAGIKMPGLVAESMGGVNGGRFSIALLDAEGYIIADRDVRPPRGYEFKEKADIVLAGLDARLADASGCGGATNQQATD